VSIQYIQENPQDTSNFYLANIYQAIVDPNISNIPNSPLTSPPPFSPPIYAVWVNALWFLSLVISLTCALLATLLQQWARRYLKITQSRYSPHKRARIRAFFAEGVEKCLLPWTVDTLPTLLHISLFLFFAGLVVFLSNVNLTIFKLVLSWVGLCTTLYGCITCMPIIRHDSPYYTPLSLPVWHIVTGILIFGYRFLRWFNRSVRFRYDAILRFLNLQERCRKSLVQGMQKTVEETALNSPSDLDTRAFMWTFDCLDEDHELERCFSGLPGFRSSKLVHDPLPMLPSEQKSKLYEMLTGFLDRTFSSDLLPESVKSRRAMICAKAVDPEHTPKAFSVLEIILCNYQYSGPLAIGIANILRSWRAQIYGDDVLTVQAIISEIVARSHPLDDSWYTLASNELGFQEAVLKDYAAYGDSLSLAILIYVVRQHFSHFNAASRTWLRSWPYDFWKVLKEASEFNAQDTTPELQHEFCALWNQIVCMVQDGNHRNMAFRILGKIRNVYLSLHQDTGSAPTCFSPFTSDHDHILSDPTSYPLCKVLGHLPDSASHIHDDHASASFTLANLADHDNLALVSSPPSPDLPPSSTHSPLPIGETLTDTPLVDNNISLLVRKISEDSPTPSSPSLVTSSAVRESMDTYPRSMNLSTPEPSVSTIPPKLLSPPDAVVGGHAVSHTAFRDLNVPSSAIPTPFLGVILPTGRSLPSDSNDWN
jgi:hypothetical protein